MGNEAVVAPETKTGCRDRAVAASEEEECRFCAAGNPRAVRQKPVIHWDCGLDALGPLHTGSVTMPLKPALGLPPGFARYGP
jgi:hypothetical protein